MRIQKVLMTADCVGGVWTYALELAGALAKAGSSVGLAVMGANLTRDQRRNALSVPGLRLFESDYKLEWMEDPWDDLAEAGAWLLDVEHQFEPEVVHLNSYVHGSLPWRAPVIVVGHSCVLSWWRAAKTEPLPLSWRRYQRAVQRGIQSASLLIAPTQTMLRSLVRDYNFLGDSLVISNGRSADQFSPSSKEPYLLAVGRLWDEAKNITALDSIAPALAWPVYTAGETLHPNGSRVRLDHVRALGTLSPLQLRKWLGGASIFLSPALYEPFGLSILEAALAGCCLVLSDIPSLRETWDRAAVFVPTNRPKLWESAIASLISGADLRSRLALLARKRALEFSPEQMAVQYRNAYEFVLQRRRSYAGQTLAAPVL